MSLWGATVITNLLSAVPVFGQDLVELIWGGFSVQHCAPHDSDIMMKILLYAGKSSNFRPFFNTKGEKEKYNTRNIIIQNNKNVKNLSISPPSCLLLAKRDRGKSAMVHNNINTNYEAIQRLNAGDLIFPYLVGLFEGDGWFTITKNGKYLKYEFGIEMYQRDIQLIYKIKKILGIGQINFRSRNNQRTVMFRVRNKNHLKSIIINIFDKYPLLSNKKYDYFRFKENLLSDVIYSEQLKDYIRPIGQSVNSEIVQYINTKYFKAWLIGFIEAEGCFSIYKPALDSSKVASFDISQTNGSDLIEAIKIYLNLTSKVYLDKTNNFKLKVSSIRQIENIIKFIQKAPIKLLGYKKLQYLLFIKELRKIPRYSNKFQIPNKYIN